MTVCRDARMATRVTGSRLYLRFAIANGPETCFEEITPDKS